MTEKENDLYDLWIQCSEAHSWDQMSLEQLQLLETAATEKGDEIYIMVNTPINTEIQRRIAMNRLARLVMRGDPTLEL